MDEREVREIRRLANREHVTVAEWVRRAIRDAARRVPGTAPDRKLGAIRAGAKHDFPTATIDDMLEEIERGYGAGE